MQILSTNISNPTYISWNGKAVQTGIYKTPVKSPIFLRKRGVKDDTVSDRRVHGGEFKACYLFSADQYRYWKSLYPKLKWNYGMFGENLTISGLDESLINIGDVFKVGEALVQITQPREPCFKLGVKFGTQAILRQFIEHSRPGTYVKIIQEGFVTKGDDFVMIEKASDSLSIQEFFNLLFSEIKDQKMLELAIKNKALPKPKREKLITYLK